MIYLETQKPKICYYNYITDILGSLWRKNEKKSNF